MPEKIVEILVQGGLAGVAVFSLWINYKMTSNHINHSNDVINNNTEVLSKLHQLINDKLK